MCVCDDPRMADGRLGVLVELSKVEQELERCEPELKVVRVPALKRFSHPSPRGGKNARLGPQAIPLKAHMPPERLLQSV